MERDGEAKIYHEFFHSRVRRLNVKSEGLFHLSWTICVSYIFFPLVPSLIHSSGSISGASGSLCVFGGRGEQAEGDTKVENFQPL